MTTLGVLLRQRRTLAKLSRARLARLAGLCEATIKFIEFDKHSPRTQTRLKLLAISDLSLSATSWGSIPKRFHHPSSSAVRAQIRLSQHFCFTESTSGSRD